MICNELSLHMARYKIQVTQFIKFTRKNIAGFFFSARLATHMYIHGHGEIVHKIYMNK